MSYETINPFTAQMVEGHPLHTPKQVKHALAPEDPAFRALGWRGYMVATDDQIVAQAGDARFGPSVSLFAGDVGRAKLQNARIKSGVAYTSLETGSMPDLLFGGGQALGVRQRAWQPRHPGIGQQEIGDGRRRG